MKHIFLFLLLFTGYTDLQAQTQGKIIVHPKMLEQKGNILEIEMVFDMSGLSLRRTESRIFTPVLVSANHHKEIQLPAIVIKGNRRFKADRRKETLSGHHHNTMIERNNNQSDSIYAIEKFDKQEEVPYYTTILYEGWMEDASLDLREDVYGCCGKIPKSVLYRNVIPEVITQNEIRPKFNWITPEAEQEKLRFEIGNAYLDFAQGKSVIDPSFRNNRRELEKINQLILRITSDTDVQVQSIEMRGYASPEGSKAANYTLSSQRAQAMRDHFAHVNIRIPGSLFQVGSGGEDWETLKTLINDYPVSHRKEIVNIIETVPDLDEREQQLKKLGGGEPYRQLFRDLYPKLRRVDCQINYIVREFTIDEGKERIITKPKMLSQHEMYRIAQSYTEGSTEFYDMLLTVQKHFPEDDVANLNAAAVALTDKNPKLAETFLLNVKQINVPEYANCMGVFYTLKGGYNKAETYLNKAKEEGLTEAVHNLHELQKVKR